MKALQSMVDRIREAVDEVERMANGELSLKPQQLTLAEAVPVLRLSLGEDAYFSVSCEVDCYSHGKPELKWTIYHNTKVLPRSTVSGDTLDAAVDQILAAVNAHRKQQTVEQADAAIGTPAAVAEFRDPTTEAGREAVAAAAEVTEF